MEFEQLLGIVIFACTVATYLTFLGLGRRWRRGFEAKGIKYWRAPKEKRVKELMSDVWHPKIVAAFYTMAYFTNGYMKITFSMWAPLFLLQYKGIGTFEAALFIALIYTPWQWKMFVGMVSDAIPIKFKGRIYRRKQWFLIAGIFSIAATTIFLFSDPMEMPVWTTLFLTFTALTSAGAIFDMAADAYAVDVIPPEFHARVLGVCNTVGQAIGGAVASLAPIILLRLGGYQLVFIIGGLTGILAFPFLLLKEPKLEYERVFSKLAIAFTFTEKTVLAAALLMMNVSIGIARISNPTGGMFSLIMNEVLGNLSPEQAGNIALAALLAGIPGSLIGGWVADKWGHKRIYIISGIVAALSGYLWATLRPSIIWFVTLAMATNFIMRFNAGSRMALMGDATPLALSATVFQMYMSFTWIGNVPSSLIVGILLPVNLPLLMVFLSSISFIPLVFARFIKPYEVGKAVKV